MTEIQEVLAKRTGALLEFDGTLSADAFEAAFGAHFEDKGKRAEIFRWFVERETITCSFPIGCVACCRIAAQCMRAGKGKGVRAKACGRKQARTYKGAARLFRPIHLS